MSKIAIQVIPLVSLARLSSSQSPLNMDSLLDRVADQRPMGKGARSAIARAVHQLFQAVPVAPDCVGWLSHLLRGATFRHPLTSEEVRRGYLLLDELEHIAFFPQFFQFGRAEDRKVTISLFGGPLSRPKLLSNARPGHYGWAQVS